MMQLLPIQAPKRLDDMIWYLAHPYSGDPVGNVGRCIAITNDLLDHGLKIYAPIVMTHALHVTKPRDVDFWYIFDVEFCNRCDGLILAPGWRASKGCWFEKGIFTGQKKPVLEYDKIKWDKLDDKLPAKDVNGDVM